MRKRTHARCLRLWRPSLSVISAAFIAFCHSVSIAEGFGERDMRVRAHRQILFIGKDQEHSLPQLILVQHTLQLLTSFRNTVTIVAINNEDDALRILEVMPPERSDLILSTNIPHGKLDVFVFHSLYVEACRRVSISLIGDEMDETNTNQWLGLWSRFRQV